MARGYTEKDIDKGIEVWELNDVETWVGRGFEEIVKGAIKQTGMSRSELLDSPKKIPRARWDSLQVRDTEAEFQPLYTYSNMIMKDIIDNIEMPYLLSSTEY